MNVVAVQGLRGGTGASSVVAGLAEALSQAGEAVLCIDMDPRNLLRLHFNHAWEDTRGWARARQEGDAWHEPAFVLGSQLHFLPHGLLDATDHQQCDSRDDDPGIWQQRLAALEADAYRWVLIDVPAHAHDTQRQARRAADTWLVVAQADPACHALLEAHTVSVGEYLLINRLAARSALQGDLHALWQRQHGDWLVPLSIHRDEAMFEALAHKRGVVSHRPNSLASQDIHRLAAWLLAQHEASPS
ncbi:cellulose biosynthesis protein BcsQ [Halomonas organivorans]|uniref:Cellulose synthase operon protein YhjQ n=1 Tax=Halomonas organivorans TaxID=257772 RepID=A0A7W5BXT9_9GAMM|nr:cellulose biosynthesis protein BcsQ [Halomonas organivorans]MBB3141016.1 cellulose synthase operon protein YhjQ [Halomonas organivorans]